MPPDTKKISSFYLPLCSRVKKEKKSKCLMSTHLQYLGIDVTPTHSLTQSLLLLLWLCRCIRGKCTHTCKLFTSHAQTMKSVKWSYIKDENKPVSGRCPPRKWLEWMEPWELVRKSLQGSLDQTWGCAILPHTLQRGGRNTSSFLVTAPV